MGNRKEERRKILLAFMGEKTYVPMKEKELAIILHVKAGDRKELKNILLELVREGKVQVNKRGRYLLAETDSSKYIVVGTYERATASYGFVVPDNRKAGKDIYISAVDSMGAVSGAKVMAEITKPQTDRRSPEGKIIQIFGMSGDSGIDMLSIIKAFGVPVEFPERVANQAERIKDNIIEADFYGREDLRDELMITIDSEDARDLDDAVSLRKEGENYILGVHIADVSNYVQENSALDHEALDRGTSIYLPDRVIPMLPPKLSNGICSLNPREDRLTLSCIMTISPQGRLLSHRIIESVIRTNERMTYTSVNKIIALKDREERERYPHLVDMLDDMYVLSGIIRANRRKKGSIDFDFPECGFRLDEKGNVEDIYLRESNEATRLIEDFMLMANETVAMHYHNRKLPFVYRTHDTPDPEKIQQLAALVNNYGYHISLGNEEIAPAQIQKLLEAVADTPEAELIARTTLKSMKQAVYSPECTGHFGLACDNYCHFTSPIRRYPDLQIHRIIKDELRGRLNEAKINHYNSILTEIAAQSSRTERRAVELERECNKSKTCQYMSEHIGESYDGIISGITEWGIYVELPNTVEGLVHISKLPGDFYVYDESGLALVGRRHGRRYSLGEKVRVICSSVNQGQRTIDFDLV